MSVPRFTKFIVAVIFATCCPRLSQAADLTVQWDPPTDWTPAGYVLLLGEKSGSYYGQFDIGPTRSYTVNGLTDGRTYYFVVRAYDASGGMSLSSNEVFETALASAPPIVNALELTSNVASPQIAGTSVKWLATASGGVPPYEFQWSFYGAGQWTVWPWTAAYTWTWTPWAPGNDYQVRVAARNSGSSSPNGEMVQSIPFTVTSAPTASVTLQTDVASPQRVGSTIRWSATASGGVAPYQYRWWVFNGSVWSAATAWGTSSTWSWTPTAASAGYIVQVWVRSAGSFRYTAEASASVPFPIGLAPK